MGNNDEDIDLPVTKENRRKRKEAEKNRYIVEPFIPFIPREETQRDKEKRINLAIEKILKKT